MLISIDITDSSPFCALASPILQREVLHRFYGCLSNGKSLSYEVTCQLLLMINEKFNIGKREKVLHLDKMISAVKTGHFLQLKKITGDTTDPENKEYRGRLKRINQNVTDHGGDLTCDKNERKFDSTSGSNNVFDGLSYICHKVN